MAFKKQNMKDSGLKPGEVTHTYLDVPYKVECKRIRDHIRTIVHYWDWTLDKWVHTHCAPMVKDMEVVG